MPSAKSLRKRRLVLVLRLLDSDGQDAQIQHASRVSIHLNHVVGLLVCVALFAGLAATSSAEHTRFASGENITATISPQKTTQIFVPGEVFVKFKPNIAVRLANSIENATDVSALNQLLVKLNVEQVSSLVDWPNGEQITDFPEINSYYVLHTSLSANPLSIAKALSDNANVEFAVPNYYLHVDDLRANPEPLSTQHKNNQPAIRPNDILYTLQWPLHDDHLQVQSAWNITTGSDSIVVAVIDSGLDLTHPDIGSKNTGTGFDFANNTYTITDDYGHGTLIAGLIAANTNNNNQGIAGISWGAKIMPIKVCKLQSNRCPIKTTDAINAILWAANHGADVINMSFSGDILDAGYPDPATRIQKFIDYAYNKNIVLVASAGNNNEYLTSPSDNNPSAIRFPAAYNHVIAVGAVNASDERCNYVTCPWPPSAGIGSGWGPQLDVVAPGSADYPSTDVVGAGGYTSGDYYFEMGGTSGAAAHVSGLAALILSVNPSLTSGAVESFIESTAIDLGVSGRDDVFGFGRINAFAAVIAAKSNSATPTPTPPSPGPTPTSAPPTPTPTLPPGIDGIELVSVSSHVVRPGERFYPSITIRRTSSYLDHARGDHLHAVPEDASNTFGAFPVQEVKSYVSTGGTYTFDINNDPSFVMTAPSTPGQYQSVWQMRVGGNHIGPQAIIHITVQSDPIVPTPTPLPIDCNNPPDGITLYEFSDFQGRCINFTSDVMYLGNTYFGDNVASSLKIVGNWGVTLFPDPDWGGQEWQEFSSSDSNLGDDRIGDNRASSLRVWRPGDPCATLPQGVTLYRGRDFTGISQSFSQDAMFLGNEPIGDNSVNSLRICGNYRVTLYRDADWRGYPQNFTAPGDSNLSDDPINDPGPTASSLRIIDASDACNTLGDGVTLYTQTDFGGQPQTFSSDVMFLGNTLIGDNAARSLRVCGHWVVTVFRDADWTGAWENFTGIDANLTDNPNSSPNPTASSLRMVDSFDFCRTLPQGVTLYRGRDFTGIAQTFASDVSSLGNEPIGNDTANSLRLCGYNAQLYRDPDWQGFPEEFTGKEESNLSDNPINDPNATTSSIRVWLKPPPTPTPDPTPIPTPTPWATQPDLVPFQGADWSFPLIPSATGGSRSVYPLYAGAITYLDWGVFNNSSVNVTSSFTVTVYLDLVPVIQYPFDGISANSYRGFDDWQIVVRQVGYHTLKVVVDDSGTVSEVNESNNSWEGQFYWSPSNVPDNSLRQTFLPLITVSSAPPPLPPGCNLFSSTDTPRAIPDNDPAGIESIIVIPSPGVSIADLRVHIDDLIHTYDSDLQISLITPNNTVVWLIDQVGGSGDNFTLTSLNDNNPIAIVDGVAPFTGDFRPDSPLSDLFNLNPAGIWKLHIADIVARDVGTLNAWSLEICSIP